MVLTSGTQRGLRPAALGGVLGLFCNQHTLYLSEMSECSFLQASNPARADDVARATVIGEEVVM